MFRLPLSGGPFFALKKPKTLKFAENSRFILIRTAVFLTYKAAGKRRLNIAHNRGRAWKPI